MKKETKIVWVAALIQLVNIIDFMMVMPLGPDLAQNLPITNADIGLICGSYTIAVGISGMICAKFLDAFDRKNVAIITVLGLSLATVSATFASDLNSLILARISAGIFGGPAAAISLSMVIDAVPPERRGRAMAIVMGTFSISAIFAIPFGLELAQLGTWKMPFYGIFFLGVFVLYLIIAHTPSMKTHLHKKSSVITYKQFFQNKSYIYAFLMMATAMISTYAIIPPLSAFLQYNLGYPRESLSLLYFVGGIFSLLFIQTGGRLSDKIGALTVNVTGTSIFILFLFDGFLHTPISPVMLIFVMFMGTAMLRNVAAMTAATKLPQPHERAGFMSLLSSVQHLGNGIGAFLASSLLTVSSSGELIGMTWVVSLSIIMALLQPLFLFLIDKHA